MALHREVSKNPETPDLNSQAIDLLTKLVFRHDDEWQKSDAFLVHGRASDRDRLVQAENIYNVIQNKFASTIILTGGRPDFHGSDHDVVSQSESEMLFNTLDMAKIANEHILIEKESISTYDNILNSMKLFDFSKSSKVTFLSAAFGAGRTYLTYRKLLPHLDMVQRSMTTLMDGQEITSDSWSEFEVSRKRIWGEYLRIVMYGDNEIPKSSGLMGVIEFEEVRDLVVRINEITGKNFSFH